MHRYACFQDYVDKVKECEGGLDNFTQGYKHFGIHVNSDNSVTAREWAPGAVQVYLTGEFSMLLQYLSVDFHHQVYSVALQDINITCLPPYLPSVGYFEIFIFRAGSQFFFCSDR